MSYIGREPGIGTAERFIYTATGAIATISTADDGRTLNYTVGQVSVYLNGVKQVVGTDVTCTSGNTVVFASNIASGDVVEVISLAKFSASDTVSASTGGTFSGNVSFSGTTTTTGDATHNGNIVMATNKKVQQKGSFMQSSFHQSLVLGA